MVINLFLLTFALLFLYLIRLVFMTIKAKNQSSLLKAELHLVQFAALLLTFISSIYIGFAITDNSQSINDELNIVFAIGFLLFAIVVIRKTPRIALKYLVLGFIAHAVIDLTHGIKWVSLEVMPDWYAYLCAIYDLGCAAICSLPIIYRSVDK